MNSKIIMLKVLTYMYIWKKYKKLWVKKMKCVKKDLLCYKKFQE